LIETLGCSPYKRTGLSPTVWAVDPVVIIQWFLPLFTEGRGKITEASMRCISQDPRQIDTVECIHKSPGQEGGARQTQSRPSATSQLERLWACVSAFSVSASQRQVMNNSLDWKFGDAKISDAQNPESLRDTVINGAMPIRVSACEAGSPAENKMVTPRDARAFSEFRRSY